MIIWFDENLDISNVKRCKIEIIYLHLLLYNYYKIAFLTNA